MFSISGKISTDLGKKIPDGITVYLGLRQATLAPDFSYNFDSVSPGSYSLKPILTGRTFTPTTQSVSVRDANVSNIDFSLVAIDEGIAADSVQMVLIPAATFMQGCYEGEVFVAPTKPSVPKRKVTLTRSYYIGIHEVTQAQWNKYMTPGQNSEIGPKYPATGNHYDSITAFCNRMSVAHGLQPVYSGYSKEVAIDRNANGYRLATEAEWEYAASGGDTTFFPGIPNPATFNYADTAAFYAQLNEIAWRSANSVVNGVQKMHESGLKKPNKFGLYDVCGNAYEFVEGNAQAYTATAVTDPLVLPYTNGPIFRGGGFGVASAYLLDIRNRLYLPNFNRSVNALYGFRIARLKN